MQSINYAPPPVDEIADLSECGITHDYAMHCSEWPKAYNLCRYLDTFPMCDFSQPLDDFTFRDGVIQSDWIIFFTCRPTDAFRLSCIADRLYPFDTELEEYY